MAGHAAPCSLLDSRLLVKGRAAIFFTALEWLPG